MEIFGIRFLELLPIALFFIAIFGLITANNAIKSVIYMIMLNGAVIIYWIALGSRVGTIPPILETVYHVELHFYEFADPVPQALMITTIIIGFCVTAVNIIMLNTLHRRYKTTDWNTMFDLVKEEISERQNEGKKEAQG
ncbi:MAG: cation:proton antiporter subunit C [Defluviitaleaceae bacterium]|nr:cation:proton antiporter subunit C [Defluviitaleaceae bacterium]